eukprot:m.6708 g.6708  ORF g.6708 m.6708 type:complete len:409 (+) comp3571_c0_seq1:377-1603(+)
MNCMNTSSDFAFAHRLANVTRRRAREENALRVGVYDSRALVEADFLKEDGAMVKYLGQTDEGIPALNARGIQVALRVLQGALLTFFNDNNWESGHREDVLEAKSLASGIMGSWLLFWGMEANKAESREANKAYAKISRLALKRLEHLSFLTELEYFIPQHIGMQMEPIGKDVTEPQKHLRQDVDAGIVLPKGIGGGLSYRFYLLYLAHCIDAHFQDVVEKTVVPCGGEIRKAAVKSHSRMQVKYFRDYKQAAKPRDAMNCDICRNCVTFKTVENVRMGYNALVAALGKPLSVNNNFSDNFDAPKESYGYRCIKCIFKFELQNHNWGGLIDAVDDQVFTTLQAQANTNLYEVSRRIAETQFRDKTPCILVEIQMLLLPYLDLRRKSHMPYKIVRPGTWQGLRTEFENGG